jgi:hypothetical protein
MEQEHTVYSNGEVQDDAPEGMVTVAGIGMKHYVAPGRSVDVTLSELGIVPQPYQSVRVNAAEVRDLSARRLQPYEIVTITNVVKGG